MKKCLNLVIVGGDMRIAYLSEFLKQDGNNVSVIGFDKHIFKTDIPTVSDMKKAFEKADCVIFPMPLMADDDKISTPLSNSTLSLEYIVSNIPSGKLALAGSVPADSYAIFEKYNIRLIDYLNREELAILNAIPTAEGAIQIAMEEMPITIHNCKCLVIGYGRIGKILSQKLACLGAKVSVSARNSKDFALISAAGHEYVRTSHVFEDISSYNLIINTVPVRVLESREINEIREDCIIIDLASRPGGVDFGVAQHVGRTAIWALSLPGKVAPISAALAIKDTVNNILLEEELQWIN